MLKKILGASIKKSIKFYITYKEFPKFLGRLCASLPSPSSGCKMECYLSLGFELLGCWANHFSSFFNLIFNEGEVTLWSFWEFAC